MMELGRNLICCNCKEILSLKHIVSERRLGFHSILNIFCEKCKTRNTVHTGKINESENKKYSDINVKVVLGFLYLNDF